MCNMGNRLRMLEMRYKQINEMAERQKQKVVVCKECGQPRGKRNIAEELWRVYHP